MEPIILVDSGHGGMINGQYVTAPRKMYDHGQHGIAYEGVINRQVKKAVMKYMDLEGIRYIDVCPTELDVDLDTRVNVINNYCDEYGKDNCLLISLHSNAGKGSGFEIWTSPGATKSDVYATQFMSEFQKSFPGIQLRKDMTDGDVDKESPFYILVNSKCPAILPEWLFFDNLKDFRIISDRKQQLLYANMIVNFAKKL
jgi:N-acetylmuramoyl-L-alanine amidase